MSDILDPRWLLRMARDTIRDPRGGAVEILRLNLPSNALWLCFALVILAAMFLGQLVALIAATDDAAVPFGGSVLSLGLVQAVFMALAVLAVHRIGRAFGGVGTFDGALALVIWLQFVFLLVQVGQLFVMVLIPPMAGLVAIAVIALFFWLLVNFVAVLHGFTSMGMVFVMTMASFVGMLFVLSLVLGILGLTFIPAG